MSPTKRSLDLLRGNGWTCQVVERWNSYAKIRQDLFGFIDVIGMSPNRGFLAVQATSASNLSARVAKIHAEPKAALWLATGGRIEAHGWAKKGPKGKRKTWQVNIVAITPSNPSEAVP